MKLEQAMRYLASVKAEVSGGKQVEVVLTKPDKDFQDVKVIAFPSIGKKTTRLSAANTKVTSAMSLQNLNHLVDGNKKRLCFYGKKRKAGGDRFQDGPTVYFTQFANLPCPSADSNQCPFICKRERGYRMLSEFKIDRFNANLNVGFDPYAPVVISVPETTASEFRLNWQTRLPVRDWERWNSHLFLLWNVIPKRH